MLVRKRRVIDFRAIWAEVLLVRFAFAGHRKRKQRTAVIPMRKCDDCRTPRVLARDLHRIFRRLGAGRQQQCFLRRRSGCSAVELFGDADVCLVVGDLETGVRKSTRLFGNCGDDVGIRVARIEHADAADEIDIASSCNVPNRRAGRALDPDRMRRHDAARDVCLSPLRQRRFGDRIRCFFTYRHNMARNYYSASLMRLFFMKQCVAALMLFALVAIPVQALAGTTGTLRGRVVDAATHAAVAGVTVTASSPSQTAQTVSDAAGAFSFISLQPDTYTVSASKAGYDSQSQAGITIVADQSATVSILLPKTLKVIARTTSRSAQSLVRSGVTSDVYSVNSAGQKAAATLNGSGSLTQAYGAIASAPGVNIPSNQMGWYQSVYVRGGDVDQVAYEFDGIPTTRQSDLAPIATLTSLGNQEVQIYTGGTPATSNSSGLAGYINQVIKTGTFPGYANADLGIGGPAFYHQATVEAGGARPDRLFSYYVGLSGTNQSYRFGDQFGGVSDPLYFYPLNVPTNNNVYNILDGSGGKAPNYGFIFSPGYAYAQGVNFDRENVVNLHIGVPHHDSSLRDDIQMLYVTGGIADQFLSSAFDVWYTPKVGQETGIGYPMPYLDSLYYGGPLMKAPRPQDVIVGFFPSSLTGRVPGSPVDATDRDGNWNGYTIEKLQYQKNFDTHSYLRALVWGAYSNWYINGPQSAQLIFGSDPADYEVLEHGYGGSLIYANQLSSQHLLTAEASYMLQTLQTYNVGFSSTDPFTSSLAPTGLGTILSSYGTPNGKCYNYVTGQPWSCFDRGSQGGCITPGGCYPGEGLFRFNLTPGYAPRGSPA